jgi:hypothetical protein
MSYLSIQRRNEEGNMRISNQMKGTYPKLSKWILVNIPNVINKSKVFYAFMKYSEQNHAKIIEILTRDTLPVLHYWYFPGDNKNGTSVKKGHRNLVFLAKSICDKFETSGKSAKDPRMHLLLESTILHEMVHWGDTLDGKRQRQHEEGKEFEREAYGKDVGRYW